MRQFIKNKYFLFTLALLIIVITVGISVRSKQTFSILGTENLASTLLVPFQKVFSSIGNKISDTADFIKNMKAIQDENEKMKIEVDRLQFENHRVKELMDENTRLRDALGFGERFVEYNQIAANIIGTDPTNWFNVFIIDKGVRDGIINKSAVKTGSGLVGYVIDAGEVSSKVIGLLDEGCVVSSRLTKTRDVVVVKGSFQLKNKGLCRMDNIPAETELEAGDMVETAGLGSMFPKGVLIGKVKEVRYANHDINRYAIIEPSVDFSRLEEVFVLVRKDLQ